MDYRFIVAKQSKSNYDVWLVCNVCLYHPSQYLQELYLSPLLNNTIDFVKSMWLLRHKNHHGLKFSIPDGYQFQVEMHNKEYGLVSGLSQAFNTSIVLSFDDMQDNIGYMMMTMALNSRNIEEHFLSSYFPSWHMPSAGLRMTKM